MSDVPRQRLAAVVMITDGQVHDVPAGDAEGGAPERRRAAARAAVRASPTKRDRRLVVAQAPSFGLVGKESQLKIRVEDLPEARPASRTARRARRVVTWRKDGGAPRQMMVPVGRDVPLIDRRSIMAGPTSSSSRSSPARAS